MKLVITGGGSGGHIIPLICVHGAMEERSREEGWEYECIYVGSEGGMEEEIAREEGIKYYGVSVEKFRRYRSFKNYLMPYKVMKGVMESLWILGGYRGEVLFSSGGYVSVPVVIAAKILGMRIIIHEQTRSLGLANRVLSYLADGVGVSFESAGKKLSSKKVVVTGQPIRKELMGKGGVCWKSRYGVRGDLGLVYITGGGQGSRVINGGVRKIVEKLVEGHYVIHQCGVKEYEEMERFHRGLEEGIRDRYLIRGFIEVEELRDILMGAKLLIGRSGAGTVWEVIFFGIPSLFIPLGIGRGNEQYENVEELVRGGLAEVVEEGGIMDGRFEEKVFKLLRDEKKLRGMRAGLEKVEKRNGTYEMIKMIISSQKQNIDKH